MLPLFSETERLHSANLKQQINLLPEPHHGWGFEIKSGLRLVNLPKGGFPPLHQPDGDDETTQK